MKVRKLIYGVGVNDADYVVQPKINGKTVWSCLFYRRWYKMMERCYSERFHETFPTYVECSVDNQWHSFMNFKSWMETQDWEGNQLDKDILVEGNKVYSPDTCVFVDRNTNVFLTDSGASRGKYPIGVYYEKDKNLYRACIGVNGKQKKIGRFTTPEEAHQAWYVAKRELAIELAAKQPDPRVAAALLARFP